MAPEIAEKPLFAPPKARGWAALGISWDQTKSTEAALQVDAEYMSFDAPQGSKLLASGLG